VEKKNIYMVGGSFPSSNYNMNLFVYARDEAEAKRVFRRVSTRGEYASDIGYYGSGRRIQIDPPHLVSMDEFEHEWDMSGEDLETLITNGWLDAGSGT
jgi:hypothetical protein